MCNVTAYIGRDYGRGEHSSEHVISTAARALQSNGIDGATFSDAVGMWRGEVERSVRVELLDCSIIDAHAALYDMCVDLMQWSIIYTIDGRVNVSIENDPTAARAEYAA
jgi:hypothetical protein